MIDMPYHLGCYDTEKGEHDIDVTSPVECLIHCKVISWLLIISLPCISIYIYLYYYIWQENGKRLSLLYGGKVCSCRNEFNPLQIKNIANGNLNNVNCTIQIKALLFFFIFYYSKMQSDLHWIY